MPTSPPASSLQPPASEPSSLASGLATNLSHFEEARRVFQAEIDGLNSALQSIQPSFDQAVETILGCQGKVVVTGLGKSGIIGHKISATLASTGTPSLFMNASEALHGDLGMVSQGDVVLMLSNSASTPELIKMIPSLRRARAQILGIFGSHDTPLAQTCDLVLKSHIPKEACPLGLAPMTTSTAALVIGDALASALIVARGFQPHDFAVLHPGGTLGRRLLLKVQDVMHTGEKLPVVSPEADLREVLAEMTRSNLGGVCVCHPDKTLLGFISDGDIRRHLITTASLEVGTAEKMMTRDPVSTTPEATLSKVIDLMEGTQRKFYTVPVVDGKTCVGLVRMHDIVSES